MWNPFRRLAERWTKLKEEADLEWQERLEATRQAREATPDRELFEVVSPGKIFRVVGRANHLGRVFVSVYPCHESQDGMQPVVVFQHCLDIEEIGIEWVGDTDLVIRNRCNEMSVDESMCTVLEQGDQFVRVRLRSHPAK